MLSFMNVKAHSQKVAFGSVPYIVNQFLVKAISATNKQGSETGLLKTERELKCEFPVQCCSLTLLHRAYPLKMKCTRSRRYNTNIVIYFTFNFLKLI